MEEKGRESETWGKMYLDYFKEKRKDSKNINANGA